MIADAGEGEGEQGVLPVHPSFHLHCSGWLRIHSRLKPFRLDACDSGEALRQRQRVLCTA